MGLFSYLYSAAFGKKGAVKHDLVADVAFNTYKIEGRPLPPPPKIEPLYASIEESVSLDEDMYVSNAGTAKTIPGDEEPLYATIPDEEPLYASIEELAGISPAAKEDAYEIPTPVEKSVEQSEYATARAAPSEIGAGRYEVPGVLRSDAGTPPPSPEPDDTYQYISSDQAGASKDDGPDGHYAQAAPISKMPVGEYDLASFGELGEESSTEEIIPEEFVENGERIAEQATGKDLEISAEHGFRSVADYDTVKKKEAEEPIYGGLDDVPEVITDAYDQEQISEEKNDGFRSVADYEPAAAGVKEEPLYEDLDAVLERMDSGADIDGLVQGELMPEDIYTQGPLPGTPSAISRASSTSSLGLADYSEYVTQPPASPTLGPDAADAMEPDGGSIYSTTAPSTPEFPGDHYEYAEHHPNHPSASPARESELSETVVGASQQKPDIEGDALGVSGLEHQAQAGKGSLTPNAGSIDPAANISSSERGV